MEKTNVQRRSEANLKFRRLMYYILGVLEVLLAFRLVLKILGSNPESTFVSAIYALSGIFVAPFTGIFGEVATEGLETTAVLEPALIVAMVVYALVVYGIVKLFEIMTNRNYS